MRFFLLLLFLTATVANSYPIEIAVNAKANGGFGPFLGGSGLEPDPSILEMVEAVALSSGDQIIINSSGIIITAPGLFLDANGLTIISPNGYAYSPLEESSVDSGALSLPRSDLTIINNGALMGAFIDAATVGAPDFLALNSDPDPDFVNFLPAFPLAAFPDPIPVGDILSEDLFLIGAGPFSFIAPYSGSLFLGVNDAYVPNNFGAFTVSIQVPVPATLTLLVLGLFALRYSRNSSV